MAFLIGDQLDKQYLNLSTFAYDTIQSDILAFGNPGLSTFINRVFSNFYLDANASISLALKRKRDEWLETLAFLPNREDAVDCLLIAEKNRLKTEATSYPKDRSIKIRLNNKNYEYLTDPKGTCREDEYYKRGKKGCVKDCSGMYIKAILEEYVRKPFLEREAIYFHEQLECIDDAISQQKQLKVTAQSGAQFYMRPHSVATDKQSAYHYLVGVSHRIDQDESEARPFSFRVTRIRDITLCKSRSGFLNSKIKSELSQLIAEKGASFIGGNTEKIRVRLTDRGNNMYQNILHLRPTYLSYEENEGHIYTFECTPSQAKYYFTRFGKHAQVLSPAFLVDDFRRFYQEALRQLPDPQQTSSP